MLHRNGKEIEQLFRNGEEVVLLHRNGVIIYDKRQPQIVTKTFQDLIDEGYVTIERTWPNGDSYSQGWVGRAVGLTVSANCPYTLAQVTDFMDVFNSTKMVSFGGVVGEGTIPNAFLWPQSHWLTDDEVYALYNNVTLSHDIIGLQFKYLDWSNKSSVTIKYNSESGNWYFTDSGVFGPNMPETINVDVGARRFTSMHDVFGRHNIRTDNVNNPMSNTVTVNWITTTNNGVNDTIRSANGMFEGASKLTTFTGIGLSSCPDLANTFAGCSSLVTIPQTAASSGFSSVTTLNKTFANCTSLQSIVPIIYVTSVTNTTQTFAGDSSLTTFYLNGLNAKTNSNWDLSDTAISSSCIAYLVDNLTVWSDFDPTTDTYKNITFPVGASLSNAQLTTLNNNGWKVYQNGSELTPTV